MYVRIISGGWGEWVSHDPGYRMLFNHMATPYHLIHWYLFIHLVQRYAVKL